MPEELATFSILHHHAAILPANYIPMLFSKWMRSLKSGNHFYKYARPSSFYDHYHRFITHLINQPTAQVTLAVLSDDHDVVLGFSVHRGAVLDYVYVHPEQRGQKMSNHLIPSGITTFTHITRIGEIIWKAKYPDWIFDPFA